MAGRYAFTRRPGWIAGHVIVLALFTAMILLGHWQLTVSERKHFSLQNFGYAFQWWIFACFGVGMWLRVIRDNARARARERLNPLWILSAMAQRVRWSNTVATSCRTSHRRPRTTRRLLTTSTCGV